MLQVTPRAYVNPFILLILCHHLPLWIVETALDPPEDSVCYHDFHRWFNQTLVLHIVIPSVCLLSVLITLFSPIYRSPPTIKTETPLIAIVFIGYVCLVVWDIYAFERSLVHDCLRATNHASAITYDLVMSCIVVVIWLFTSCTWRTRTPDSVRDKCSKRFRCLTRAILCKQYDEEEFDLYAYLSIGLSKFLSVSSRDKETLLPMADIIFAFHLLTKRQAREHAELPAPAQAAFHFDPSILEDAARYGKLAGGIYGWIIVLFYEPFAWHKICGCCQPREVRHHMRSVHEPVRRWQPGPRDDISFVRYSGVDPTSVQFISTANDLFQSPFTVCRDDDRKELIVCVRGSLSWHDVLTDILAKHVPMSPDEAMASPTGEAIYTHEGVLRSSRRIVGELQSGTLKEIFWEFAMARCRLDDPNANWRIVVTGHSLGAGIAAVLTLMLRKQFNAVGFLFAPLPVFDETTCAWSMPYMTTLVYGDDWVPRISVGNIVRLRNDLMEEYQRVSNATLWSVWWARYDTSRLEPKIHPDWTDVEPVRADNLDELTIPGSIYHIETVNKARSCTCERLLGPQPLRCVRRERHEFDRLWFNSRTLSDHMPEHYGHCIEQVIPVVRESQDVV
ncbi:hypothetical protein AeNC1_001269 [Aphanomyces euteiches]|nr:hypothetical protein AeNC1_001269 [Aphanomyces euteiches]